jgi:hypothetical protein
LADIGESARMTRQGISTFLSRQRDKANRS